MVIIGGKLSIVLPTVNKPFCGINSTCYTMHQGSSCCYFWLHLSTSFQGKAATHSLGCYGDNPLEVCFLVGHYAQAKYPLFHSPTIPRSTRHYIEEIPLNAKMGGAWQTFDGNSSVFTLYFPRKCCADLIWHEVQPMHPRCWVAWFLLANQNFGTSMGASSGFFMCCIKVEQVDPDYPGMYYLLHLV